MGKPLTLEERCRRVGNGPWAMSLDCLFGTMGDGPVGPKPRSRPRRCKTRTDKTWGKRIAADPDLHGLAER